MAEEHQTPKDKNTITVTINGKSYCGCITLDGIALTEKEMGRPFTSFANHIEEFGIAELLAILRYALHPINSPDQYLTDEEWKEISTASDFGEVFAATNLIVPLLFKSIPGYGKTGNAVNDTPGI